MIVPPMVSVLWTRYNAKARIVFTVQKGCKLTFDGSGGFENALPTARGNLTP